MQLTDFIKEKTLKIKNFSQKEKAAKDYEFQHKIDENFRTAIQDVNVLVKEIKNTCNNSNFTLSKDDNKLINELLLLCKNSAEKARVESYDINLINKKGKDVRDSLESEWNIFYNEETASVLEVLDIIKNIADVDTNMLIRKIGLAKNWNTNEKNVKTMMAAIKEAHNQINKLELTKDTLLFLKKVIAKEATLDDVTKDVMLWLEKESLKKKVKISF